MAKKPRPARYKNSIKKSLTCMLTITNILGIAITLAVVFYMCFYFFYQTKDDVVTHLLELQQ